MFSIKQIPFGNSTAYQLTNSITEEYVEIVPTCGAIINAWYVQTALGLINVVDGFTNDEEFFKSNNTSFKSNFLFPFPNRIKDGKYSFNNENFQLPINFPQENNSIHGLVFDKMFKLISLEEGLGNAKLVLKFEATSMPGFPFPFEIKLIYDYSLSGLNVTSEILNTGEHSFPFGLGWHHYFMVGQTISLADFSFPSIEILEVDSQMIPNGNVKPYKKYLERSRIGSDQFDNCFYIGNQGSVEVILSGEKHGLNLIVSFDSQIFPYLQIYTPPHRNSIAIEPMTCAPDVFNNELGIKTLDAKDTFVSNITLMVN